MGPTHIQHVIWDWNGTLLNDRWLCIEAINSLLSARGLHSLDEKRYREIFDFPVRDYYKRAGFDFDKEPFEVPALEFIRIYSDRKYECSLSEGAIDCLELFKSLGITQSLLSASEEIMLQEMISYYGIAGYFSEVTGLNDHYAKGKEQLSHLHLNKIDKSRKQRLWIGDTCHDHQIADLHRIECWLCSNGHFPEDRLRLCGSRIVSSLAHLPAALELI